MDIETKVKKGELILKDTNLFNYYNGDLFRYPSFPLIEAGITKKDVVKYFSSKPEYDFPKISNCVGCFHHTVQQLQEQYNNPFNKGKMEWYAKYENKYGKTFKKRRVGKKSYPMPMDYIKELPFQLQMDFIDFASCDAGSCTD